MPSCYTMTWERLLPAKTRRLALALGNAALVESAALRAAPLQEDADATKIVLTQLLNLSGEIDVVRLTGSAQCAQHACADSTDPARALQLDDEACSPFWSLRCSHRGLLTA